LGSAWDFELSAILGGGEGGKPSMKIQVNGEDWQVESPATIEQVLARLNPGGGSVAVVVNDIVIPAAQRAACALKEGDRVEILTFAGGG